MTYTMHYDSPLGKILLAADEEGMTGVWFEAQKYFAAKLPPEHEEGTMLVLGDACRWLDVYFSGREPDFAPKLHLIGPDFRQAVWALLLQIPYGQTTTYSALAKQLAEINGGKRVSAQAVGGPVGHNPVSIIVPCHRVVGSDGSLTGYADTVYADRLALSAQQTGKDRCALLAQCERQLLESCTVVPLMAQQKRLLLANGVRDLVFDPFFPVLDLTWAKMS